MPECGMHIRPNQNKVNNNDNKNNNKEIILFCLDLVFVLSCLPHLIFASSCTAEPEVCRVRDVEVQYPYLFRYAVAERPGGGSISLFCLCLMS